MSAWRLWERGACEGAAPFGFRGAGFALLWLSELARESNVGNGPISFHLVTTLIAPTACLLYRQPAPTLYL
jgi:hypothetical protein